MTIANSTFTVTGSPSSVTSVSGTANQIDSTGGTSPVLSIDAAYVGQTSITTLGTITSGTWHGTAVGSTYGGTGVNNGSSTITLAGNLVTSGANSVTFTSTGATNVTLPTSGTLCTTVGSSSIVTVGTITAGVWNGTAVDVAHGGTGNTTFTAYSVVCAGTTATGVFQNVSGVGSSGNVLTSNGAGALPTWQAAAGGGTTYQNILIGGDFDTNPFQMGTSTAVAANSGTVAVTDMWSSPSQAGVGALTVTKDTAAPTQAQAGILTNSSLKVAVATANASPGATDFSSIQTVIEGYNFATIAQQSFTLSFWVYATVTGTSCVIFQNSGRDRIYIAEYTITTTLTWQLITITVPASPSAGSWSYTNGVGLRIAFGLLAGSSFQGTAASWLTSGTTFTGSSSQVNHLSSLSNVFQIALVQVNVGSSAAVYQKRSLGQELLLCQRYLNTSFDRGVTPAQNVGTAAGEYVWQAVLGAGSSCTTSEIRFPATMRTQPTMTLYSPGAANALYWDESGSLSASQTNVYYASIKGVTIYGNSNASTAAGATLGINWVAKASLA